MSLRAPDRIGISRWSSPFEAEPTALLAVVAVGLLMPRYIGIGAVAVAATAFILLAWISPWASTDRGVSLVVRGAPFVALMFLVFKWALRLFPGFEWSVPQPLLGEALGTTLILSVAAMVGVACWKPDGTGRWRQRLPWIATVLLVIAALALSANVIRAGTPLIDVIAMHEVAATELTAGNNPYATMVVEDTNPLAEDGAVLVGYVYPPTTLATYAASYLVFGDARWATAIAVAAFVVLMIAPWRRGPVGDRMLPIAGALMFVSLPYLDMIVNFGWTDVLALPFLVLAAQWWSSRPLLAAAMLGIALSTKQYFIVVLPILLLLGDSHRWKRLGIVAGVVAATYAPFLLSGPEVITNPAATLRGLAYRPDSLGLPNLKVNVPRSVSYVLAGFVGAVVGLRGGSSRRIFLGIAGTLAVAFVTGTQAFVNYWVLVAGILVIAIAVRSDEPAKSEPERIDAGLEVGAD